MRGSDPLHLRFCLVWFLPRDLEASSSVSAMPKCPNCNKEVYFGKHAKEEKFFRSSAELLVCMRNRV